MEFQVLSVSGANPSYGTYNPGPTTSQLYTGDEFTDYHEDGTSHCAQAQAMPAVVALRMKFKDLEDGTGAAMTTEKGLPAGTVLKIGSTGFPVTSYVENPDVAAGDKETYIPVACSGATMVRCDQIEKGTDSITAGSLIATADGSKNIGIAMIDEAAGSESVMVYVC